MPLEVSNGALDIGPGGVLGEYGTDHDLEGRVRGPPMLRAIQRQQALIYRFHDLALHVLLFGLDPTSDCGRIAQALDPYSDIFFSIHTYRD